LKVVEVDPKTRYFPASRKASVTKRTAIGLDARKALIVVGDSDFLVG
jgi:hypothetical protein